MKNKRKRMRSSVVPAMEQYTKDAADLAILRAFVGELLGHTIEHLFDLRDWREIQKLCIAHELMKRPSQAVIDAGRRTPKGTILDNYYINQPVLLRALKAAQTKEESSPSAEATTFG